ncbi:hypothetical protein [Streptomyces sp. NPDC058665]|uniref:hypothetical protein n=1 Tax=Streptomyces sp. NPDC058665 TaxID=3346586 RepID=UPI003667E72E
MRGPAVTAFAETAALYAILNDDQEEAERIVSEMPPNERAEFAGQLDQLQNLMTDRFGNDLRPHPLTRLPGTGGRILHEPGSGEYDNVSDSLAQTKK